MINVIKSPFFILASVGALSACGGGTTTPTTTTPTTYYELLDTTGGTATVAVITLDAATPSAGSVSGSYAYATADTTVGASVYDLDAASALSSDQTSSAYSYVSGLDTTTDNKIVVVVTDAGDLPTNSTVTYNGQALVTVTDAGSTYEGTMESTITANFGTTGDTVTVALDTITDATETAGATTTYTPTGTEDITFTDLAISGSSFTADGTTTASVTGFGGPGATFSTTGATLTAQGFFAGSTGQEVAGAATIDATGGTALVTFTGTQ